MTCTATPPVAKLLEALGSVRRELCAGYTTPEAQRLFDLAERSVHRDDPILVARLYAELMDSQPAALLVELLDAARAVWGPQCVRLFAAEASRLGKLRVEFVV